MIKQATFFFLVFFWSTLCWCQNYTEVDAIVAKYPTTFNSPDKLAKKILEDFSTDQNKVRALYTWIAGNIAYNISEKQTVSYSYVNQTELEASRLKQKLKTAKRVITKGEAVCHGYSTLFTVVCEKMGIESRIITGAGKTRIKDINGRYNSNHAWNAVTIDNKEYLIDTTWGGGPNKIIDIEDVDYTYFFTHPSLLIKDHYPDTFDNALLKEKVNKSDFLDAPLYYDISINVLSPKNGVIKKGTKGHLVNFSFSTNEKVKSVSYRIGTVDYHIKDFTQDKNLEFSVYLSNVTRGRELIIFLNHKAVIGYKLIDN